MEHGYKPTGERRGNFRGSAKIGARIEVQYRRADAEETQQGNAIVSTVTTNIGLGGCFALSDKPEPLGAELVLMFRLGADPNRYRVRGIVRWVSEIGRLGSGMGIRFTDLNSEVRRALGDYLATNNAR